MEPSLPPVIRELSSQVANRIAAGEVIHRASAALKELLENSLDAGATEIEVLLLQDGGFRIRDNGHGIRFEDLPILCRRHTTSKLASFEDLKTVETFGFRGEALCSVSYVAKMTVTTRPNASSYGLRVDYTDGEMCADPTPCPALPGTSVYVREFFERDAVRRQALQGREECSRAVEIVQSYALHCLGVGFVVRQESRRYLELLIKAEETQIERISKLFGCGVARTMLSLEQEFPYPERRLGVKQSVMHVSGWISNADGDGCKRVFLLFVNGRCVECGPMKRAIQGLYAYVLPKKKPFVYLSLQLPSSFVDVNVHPTKREVEFLSKEYIIQKLTEEIQSQLEMLGHSRTVNAVKAANLSDLRVQLPLPHGCAALMEREREEESVHGEGRRLMKGHQYVGMTGGRFAFVHFENGVYLLDLKTLSHDFFCQLIWRGLGGMERHEINPPLFISDLMEPSMKGCSSQTRCKEAGVSPGRISTLVEALLSKRDVLQDLFSLAISERGLLISLPKPLECYPLEMRRLPSFLVSLAERLKEWDEPACSLQPTVEVIAELFRISDANDDSSLEQLQSLVKEVLMPAMRREYCPSPERIADRSIVKLTTVQSLCSRCGR